MICPSHGLELNLNPPHTEQRPSSLILCMNKGIGRWEGKGNFTLVVILFLSNIPFSC